MSTILIYLAFFNSINYHPMIILRTFATLIFRQFEYNQFIDNHIQIKTIEN